MRSTGITLWDFTLAMSHSARPTRRSQLAEALQHYYPYCCSGDRELGLLLLIPDTALFARADGNRPHHRRSLLAAALKFFFR